MSNIIPVDPRPNLVAGGKVAPIIPNTMDEAYRLAKAVCMAGMAPRGMDTPEKAMIAIMRGMEVGLSPFQALDKIAVVNGRPTIWGDGAMALVRGSGVCEWVKEAIDGTGDNRVAVCEAKRRGDPTTTRRTFSVADAKKAGLWNKQGPWQQFPERMLQMRARAFCLRDLFADVLGGLYLKEEIEDTQPEPRRIAPPPPAIQESAPSGSHAEPEATVEAAAPIAAETVAEGSQPKRRAPPPPGGAPAEKPAPAPATYAENAPAFFKRFNARCAEAKDYDALQEAWLSMIDPITDDMDSVDFEEAQAIMREHERRLEP